MPDLVVHRDINAPISNIEDQQPLPLLFANVDAALFVADTTAPLASFISRSQLMDESPQQGAPIFQVMNERRDNWLALGLLSTFGGLVAGVSMSSINMLLEQFHNTRSTSSEQTLLFGSSALVSFAAILCYGISTGRVQEPRSDMPSERTPANIEHDFHVSRLIQRVRVMGRGMRNDSFAAGERLLSSLPLYTRRRLPPELRHLQLPSFIDPTQRDRVDDYVAYGLNKDFPAVVHFVENGDMCPISLSEVRLNSASQPDLEFGVLGGAAFEFDDEDFIQTPLVISTNGSTRRSSVFERDQMITAWILTGEDPTNRQPISLDQFRTPELVIR